MGKDEMPDRLGLGRDFQTEMLVEHFLLELSNHVIGRANSRVDEYRATNVRIGDLEVHGHPVDEPVRSFLNGFRCVDLPVEKDFVPFRDGIHDDEERCE